ncbi:unnamed protein product [Urochloa humidicola]
MGSALSCIIIHAPSVSGSVQHPARPPSPSAARVIAADGSLKELPSQPLVSVSDVLSDSGAPSPFFVCNSDALYFDEPPPALAATEVLRPGQLYFVLPAAMLGRPLSSSDMAALAARAIVALPAEKPPCHWRWRGRIVPILLREDGEDEGSAFHETLNERTLGEFATVTSRATSCNRLAMAAAGTRKKRPSALKRALSMIREDAE